MGKSSQRSMEARMMRMTQQQLAEEREERRIQREILEKQKAEALWDLLSLVTLISLAGGGADEIKDWIKQRKSTFED